MNTQEFDTAAFQRLQQLGDALFASGVVVKARRDLLLHADTTRTALRNEDWAGASGAAAAAARRAAVVGAISVAEIASRLSVLAGAASPGAHTLLGPLEAALAAADQRLARELA
jgi:hypothetical protein